MTEPEIINYVSWHRGKIYSFSCKVCGDTSFTVHSKTAGYCSRRCSRSVQKGASSPGWRGGRWTNSDGYVHVYVGDATSSAYALEHVLVMEKSIGRKLKKHENVHHKNGVRDDNRLSNLELWAVCQPTGQRVIDLMRWVVNAYKMELRIMLGVTA